MDITEMIEVEKRRQQRAQDEKVKMGLLRQLHVSKMEKEEYANKAARERKIKQRSLGYLWKEKNIELDGYLATCSSVLEDKFRQQESVVKGLVKTNDTVKELLHAEEESNRRLNKEMDQVKREELKCRKGAQKAARERSKFRVPHSYKMDNRVEQARARYHTQQVRNKRQRDKVDMALKTRSRLTTEEARLDKEIDALHNQVLEAMLEASDLYEERERVEVTRIKVQEHLAKVKDKYELELQQLTSALNEDKVTEAFMRVKLTDKGEAVRQERNKEKETIRAMLTEMDAYEMQFQRIRDAIGKDNITEIVQDFALQEEDNFATFEKIGEFLVENERLRASIRELGSDNVNMELADLELTTTQQEAIRTVKDRIATLKQRRKDCDRRMDENKKTMEEFYGHVKKLIGVMQLDISSVKHAKNGSVDRTNVKAVLTDLEEEMASILHDFTMIELATRASFSTSTYSAMGDMDKFPFLLRHPSTHIEENVAPKETVLSVSETAGEHDVTKLANLMSYDEVKAFIVKSMSDKEKDESGKHPHATRTKSNPVFPMQ